MTHYDRLFLKNIINILANGSKYESRAIWSDTGEQASCVKIFALVNVYNSDYANDPPIGTIRKFPIKIVSMNYYGFGRRNPIIFTI